MARVCVPGSAVFALLAAFAASAQSRGPVIPNYQDPSKQAPASPAAAAAKPDEVDLVGPTAAQQKRAAEAKAAAEKAAAEKKAREEADAKARAEAEAKAKADADARDREKALEAVLAQRRAAESARAAAAEARRRAREQLDAAERDEARAREAEKQAQAQARALAAARKREEAACGKGPKAQACRAAVAARYDAPAPLALQLPSAAPANDALAIAPLVAPAPAGAPAAEAPRAVAMPGSPVPPPPAKPLETLAAGDRKVLLPPAASAPPAAAAAPPAPVKVASVAPAAVIAAPPPPAAAPAPAPAAVAAAMPVPRDEQVQRRPRSAEVVNDLQIGPQSLILDRLQARGDIVPRGVQLEFGYRLAIDDASAPHHLFSLGVASPKCAESGVACGLRWFVRGGLGPRNSSSFGVERHVNGVDVAQTDSLGWAANVFQAGLGYSAASFFAAADAQLEALAEDYAQNLMSTDPPQVHGSLQQWRLRASAGLQRGALTAQVRVAGYAYGGDPTATFKNVPVRGALVEDDMPGLAGALQRFSARAEGTYLLREGTDVSASYGFISYVGPAWSNANIFSATVGQKLGRFRLALGLVYELEQDAQANGYPTLFGTGSLAASF
ncbi:MAG TPA: hypothetical protein VLW85_03560 [Myxococcales bacterium]|nr:hypothetical protein [Myxococcales bacterium]